MIVLGFSDYAAQGRRLAAALESPFALIECHHFPDGESLVTVPPEVSGEAIICRSLDHPNEKLVELLLAAKQLRRQGVGQLTLVAPYLCYMRQDSAFHPGEAVSQSIIGPFLADLFERVISVDAHLHRVNNLAEAVPARQSINLSAAPLIGEFLTQRLDHPLLIGPDQESRQWVSAAAQPFKLEFEVAKKHRLGDQTVVIELPGIDIEGRNVVLLDDMTSTGRTLAEAAIALTQKGARRIDAVITHALIEKQALPLLTHCGIRNLWSSDSISHPSNAIKLAPLLASALKD